MTSNLQQNFAETDRIMKKYSQENKKLLEVVNRMEDESELLRRELAQEKILRNRQPSRKRERPTSSNETEVDLVYQQRLIEMQEKIGSLEN